MDITLITGGARSGKSSYALTHAEKRDCLRAFIATAVAIDSEMEKRIVNHKVEREERYTTFEEPYNIESIIKNASENFEVLVLDCLSTWLGNCYYKNGDNEEKVKSRVDKFIKFLKKESKINNTTELIIVTNEVGSGIIPENSLARSYRDMLGFLNRKVAEVSRELILSVCGQQLSIPIKK